MPLIRCSDAEHAMRIRDCEHESARSARSYCAASETGSTGSTSGTAPLSDSQSSPSLLVPALMFTAGAWACEACTLINDGCDSACTICATARPTPPAARPDASGCWDLTDSEDEGAEAGAGKASPRAGTRRCPDGRACTSGSCQNTHPCTGI